MSQLAEYEHQHWVTFCNTNFLDFDNWQDLGSFAGMPSLVRVQPKWKPTLGGGSGKICEKPLTSGHPEIVGWSQIFAAFQKISGLVWLVLLQEICILVKILGTAGYLLAPPGWAGIGCVTILLDLSGCYRDYLAVSGVCWIYPGSVKTQWAHFFANASDFFCFASASYFWTQMHELSVIELIIPLTCFVGPSSTLKIISNSAFVISGWSIK